MIRARSSACVLCLALVGCSSSNDEPASVAAPPAPTTGGPTSSHAKLAVLGMNALFVSRIPEEVDRYFAPDFIRHNPRANADGVGELKAAIAPGGPLANATYTNARVFAEGEYVVLHGQYDNLVPGARLTAFDLFRIEKDKIAEHWDCMQADPGKYESGHTMVDGPTSALASATTDASKDIVSTPGKGFLPVVFVGGDQSKLPDYLDPHFLQHNPLVGDGIAGLGEAVAREPISSVKFLEIQKAVGDHDFVFVRSRGTMTWEAQKPNSPKNPTVFCDLFRVAGGKIAEHWDVVQLDPNSSDSGDLKTNGAGHTMWK
jgi:predicted SnoaL-like aldol condensation-catalyzing enzyme